MGVKFDKLCTFSVSCYRDVHEKLGSLLCVGGYRVQQF